MRESIGGWDARKAGVRKTRAILIWFPHWYASLIFALALALALALAGVASLSLGRRFTLRSAIIATTIVAGLLGMAVIL